jgi:membrane protein DedA with SNARE-associated domain
MASVLDVLARYGYLIVFGSVLAEQIGLPFPAIPFLLAAGGLAGSGRLSFWAMLALAGIASLIADMVWYSIGRVGGARVLGWLCRISLEPDSCVRKTSLIFGRHGARSLLIAKFIPGFSTIAPPLAGVTQMPVSYFALFTGLGGLIWSGAFVGLGWMFSSQLEVVERYVSRLGSWAVAILIGALAAYVGWKYFSRQRFLRKIRIARITPEALKLKLDSGEDVLIVDVRDRVDFEAEPSIIPGALHLTIEDLDARHLEIPRERDIVLYCT